MTLRDALREHPTGVRQGMNAFVPLPNGLILVANALTKQRKTWPLWLAERCWSIPGRMKWPEGYPASE